MLRNSTRRRIGVTLTALLAALCACETTERRRPLPEPVLPVLRSQRGDRWRVLDGQGALVGHLVRFAAETADEHFVVRDPWQQDLGLIDAHGRAYRYLPHHLEPAWVGTGTVRLGTARILGLEAVTLEREETPGDGDQALSGPP